MNESAQAIVDAWPCFKLTPEEIARFWSHVDKTEDDQQCWLWRASGSDEGYGHFSLRRNNRGICALAHRMAWAITNGPILNGLSVLHRCDVPSCVNPNHLWLGTQAENMADMIQKKRLPVGVKRWNNRFSEADVLDMRDLRNKGWKLKEIGQKYAAKLYIICDIVNRRSWKHLP